MNQIKCQCCDRQLTVTEVDPSNASRCSLCGERAVNFFDGYECGWGPGLIAAQEAVERAIVAAGGVLVPCPQLWGAMLADD